MSSDSPILQLEDPEGPDEVPVQDDGELDTLEEVNHTSPLLFYLHIIWNDETSYKKC